MEKTNLPISNSIFFKEVWDHMGFFGDSDNITLGLSETISLDSLGWGHLLVKRGKNGQNVEFFNTYR